jgi:Phage integrase family
VFRTAPKALSNSSAVAIALRASLVLAKTPLFRTTHWRASELTPNPMGQSDVWRMILRRAAAIGIQTKIGCHTFRAAGITAYLKNGGKLEIAQQMTAYKSARTTGLYDRRSHKVSLDEVEWIEFSRGSSAEKLKTMATKLDASPCSKASDESNNYPPCERGTARRSLAST